MYASTYNDQVIAIRYRQTLNQGGRRSPSGEPLYEQDLEAEVQPRNLYCFTDFTYSQDIRLIIEKQNIVGKISFEKLHFTRQIVGALGKRALQDGDQIRLRSRPDTWLEIGEQADDAGIFCEADTVEFLLHRSSKPARIN